MTDPIETAVVGYGLAGRAFHVPLIVRQPGLRLRGVVARDPKVREEAVVACGVKGWSSIDEALADPSVRLVVIATPHDSHAELAIRALEAGKDCVVDKVMALSSREADAMIAARDRSGRMLSVFHNRRWDWDFLTIQRVLDSGRIGRPLVVESAVCRYAPPRSWRGQVHAAGTIFHDWGAHLIDQALQLGLGPCQRLSAWLTPAPWPGVDSGGHGRIVMEFDGVLFQIEDQAGLPASTVRDGRSSRPTESPDQARRRSPRKTLVRCRSNLDAAIEPAGHRARITTSQEPGETDFETVRGSWDSYYANIAEHLAGRAALAVTAEQARTVVRVLEAANHALEPIPFRKGPGMDEGPFAGAEKEGCLDPTRVESRAAVIRAALDRFRAVDPPGATARGP